MQVKPSLTFNRSMRNNYRTPSDVTARLDRTIALYKERPVLVHTAGSVIQLFDLEKYPNVESIQISPDDPNLDITSIELGYANIKPNCPLNGNSKGYSTWLSRAAQRQYRQGIDPQRIISQHPIEGRPGGGASSLGYPLFDLVMDNYPSVLEAVWMLTAMTHLSVAISREVCLLMEDSGLITVAVNRENIGSLIPSENRVYIKDHEFLWVLESLLSRFQISINPFKAMES